MGRYLLYFAFILIVSSCQKFSEEQRAELDRGQEVYIANCVSCHAADGKGLKGTYPGLVKAEINEVTTASTFNIIQNGSATSDGMKPIPITQEELKEVVNYIQNSWGNEAPFITDETITQHLN